MPTTGATATPTTPGLDTARTLIDETADRSARDLLTWSLGDDTASDYDGFRPSSRDELACCEAVFAAAPAPAAATMEPVLDAFRLEVAEREAAHAERARARNIFGTVDTARTSRGAGRTRRELESLTHQERAVITDALTRLIHDANDGVGPDPTGHGHAAAARVATALLEQLS